MDIVIGILGVLLVLSAIVCLISQTIREKISGWFIQKSWRIWFLPVIFLTYYTLLTVFLGQWQLKLFLGLALYFGLPTLILYLCGPRSGPAILLDFLIVLLLWLPVELRLIQKSWLVIEVDGHGLGYPLSVFTAVIYGLIIFTCWRKLELNCRLSVKWADLKLIGLAFLILAAIIIPVASGIGFIKPGVAKFIPEYWWALPLIFLMFIFAPALPEELIFRGIIQNLLGTKFRPIIVLIVASLIFGFAHINNKVGSFRPPNWHYIGFATLAGFAYGYVYLKRKSLLAAAILHALVDYIWMLFFKIG